MVIMKNKQTYIYLALAGVILIIYLVVAWFVTFGQPRSSSKITAPSPSPTSTQNLQTKPPVQYDTKAVKKLDQLLDEKYKLSSNDLASRSKLTASIGNKTAVASQSQTYTLRYIEPLDLFQAEIKTINIAQAKEDVGNFLDGRGLSKEGICHLPLAFYLNKSIAQQLVGKNVSFDPTPKGC